MMASGSVRSAVESVALRAVSLLKPPEIVLIGDSLTPDCSWSELGKWPFSVVNLARGGTVIRQIVSQASDAAKLGARTVLIGGGTNDLVLDHAPISPIAFDFAILMRTLDPISRRIVTLIPYTGQAELNREHDEAKAVIRSVAELYGAEVIDLDALISEGGVLRSEMTKDGIHLTVKACGVWRGAVRERLTASTKP